jgi:hypothetical protein
MASGEALVVFHTLNASLLLLTGVGSNELKPMSEVSMVDEKEG